MPRPRHSSFPSALRARELGLSMKMPSQASHLGSLRTTPEDEYAFWTVTPPHAPYSTPPFTLRFSTTALNGHALLAADEDGVVTILNSSSSLRSQMHSAPLARIRVHDNAIFDAVWLSNDTSVATAGGDASVRVIDTATHIRRALLKGASASFRCVRVVPDSDDCLLTASRDGDVRLYDLRVPSVYDPSTSREVFHRPVVTIRQPHQYRVANVQPRAKRRRVMPDRPPSGTSVTSLAFLPGDNKHFFSCGAADGAIKLWDLRAVTKGFCASSACLETAVPGMERREGCMDSRRGLACLDVNAATGKLLASSTDSTIYIYDARRMEWGHEKVLSGHTQTSFYIRAAFSPCGQFVASGSADSRAYVWDLNSYSLGGVIEPMFELDGHRGGDCSVVDWCKANSGKLATCSDDSTVKVWRATPGLRAGPVRAPADSLFNGARRYGRPDAGEKKKIKRGGCASRRLKNSDIRTFFKTVPQTVSG